MCRLLLYYSKAKPKFGNQSKEPFELNTEFPPVDLDSSSV